MYRPRARDIGPTHALPRSGTDSVATAVRSSAADPLLNVKEADRE